MVLTEDDIAAITRIVAWTTETMPMQQQAALLQEPRPEGFQFKAATRSSHEAAFELLCWAELEQNDIDPETYTELHVDSTKRVSGELFNILTTSLDGERLQTLYNCNFNGLEAWRRLSKRYSPMTPLRAM